VHVSPIDNKMTQTVSFAELTLKIDSKYLPSCISVVGPTGAGKSLIIRLLAQAMLKRLENSRATIPLPIPGKQPH
jgi:hypothetical protein